MKEYLFITIFLAIFIVIILIWIMILKKQIKIKTEDLRSQKDQLERTKSYLLTVSQSISEALIVTDVNDKITMINSKVEDLTGYLPENITGKSLEFLFDLDESRANHSFTNISLKTSQSETIPIGGSVAFIGHDSYGFMGRVIIFRDMRIEKLTGSIAHELNNLLTPILGYSDLIDATLDEGNRNKEPIAIITESTLKARELVSKLLTYCREKL